MPKISTASTAAGLHFSIDNKDKITVNVHMELMRILSRNLKFDIEFSKLFVMSLPDEVSIDFEDIIDVYDARHTAYLKEPKLEKVSPVNLEQAIELAKHAQIELQDIGFDARVILPENKSADDHITQTCLKVILNARREPKHRHRVVLLEGQSGCGKTDRVRAAVRAAGISTDPKKGEFLYLSMPTLQPEDLAGLPSPDPTSPTHFMYRILRGLDQYKVIFFDEFNRCHDKVHNAAMQLMLEKQINGMEFPQVLAIFLAQNPSDDAKYGGTYELDHAVMERVDHFLHVDSKANSQVIAQIIGDIEVAEIGVNWYNNLSQATRNELNPRRLTKMLQAYIAGEGLETTVNRKGPAIPTTQLKDMLAKVDVLTMERLLSSPSETEARMRGTTKESFDVRDRFVELCDRLYRERRAKDFLKVAHLFRNIPAEKIPLPDRDRGYYLWIRRSLRKWGTQEQTQAYMKMLEDRRQNIDNMGKELEKIAEELVFGQSDPTKMKTGATKVMS